MNTRRKIFFELEQDDSGYPPVAVESLWAVPTDRPMEFVLDNIPFFQRVATTGDTVRVEEIEGRLWYRETVGRTAHSLIRVVGLANQDPVEVGSNLESLGCRWELDSAHHLIAVDIPEHMLEQVQATLARYAETGQVDFEEAILR